MEDDLEKVTPPEPVKESLTDELVKSDGFVDGVIEVVTEVIPEIIGAMLDA